MHDKMKRVGEIIRSARNAKEVTQVMLSKSTGIAVRTIIDIEKNKRQPTFESLYKIINILDIPADHIFRPEKVCYTPEQEQVMLALQSCEEKEQAILMEITWAYIRATKNDKKAK